MHLPLFIQTTQLNDFRMVGELCWKNKNVFILIAKDVFPESEYFSSIQDSNSGENPQDHLNAQNVYSNKMIFQLQTLNRKRKFLTHFNGLSLVWFYLNKHLDMM